MDDGQYSKSVFYSPADREHGFAIHVLNHVSRQSTLRFIEIGCGTGDDLIQIIQEISGSIRLGVDIPQPNILIAEETRCGLAQGENLEFVEFEYLSFEDARFDIITSQSTLHLISTSDQDLFLKITQDLKSGGLSIRTTIYKCVYNLFWCAFRKCFRLIRCNLTDQFVYTIGRALTDLSSDLLKQRIHYMYLISHRVFGSKLDQVLKQQYGLGSISQTLFSMGKHCTT